MDTAPQFVSPSDLDRLLVDLSVLPGQTEQGFFGEGSITWQVNRESAVFLGAGRAALLQLAHPWVSAALAQHSNLMHDAIGRFHSTFRVIYTMLFGTRTQALTASRNLYRLHTTIRGDIPASIGRYPKGDHYEANEVAALRWVFATLVESAILAYNFALPDLTQAGCEAYYQESKRMAALCGISPASLPATWPQLTGYCAEMMASSSLAVDQTARRMGQAVLSGVGTWVRAPHWYRALTSLWLPPHLRAAFDLPYARPEERAVRRAASLFPVMYRHLPPALRLVGPYHDAQARLQGREPGPLILQSNRFWMGLPRLLYSSPRPANS